MVEPGTADHVRCVVAAVSQAGESAPLLRLAARAARICRAELNAVMVEDRNLALLAGWPIARHFVAATARPVPLTAELLRLAMAAARSRAEILLAGMLASSTVTWRLSEAAGPAAAETFTADDVLLVSPEVALAIDWLRNVVDGPLSIVALPLDGEPGPAREIIVVHDGSIAGRRALSLGARLAGDFGAFCRVLLPAELQPSLAHVAAGMLNAASIPHALEPLAALDAGRIADRARGTRAGLLLLPAQSDLVFRLRALFAAPQTAG